MPVTHAVGGLLLRLAAVQQVHRGEQGVLHLDDEDAVTEFGLVGHTPRRGGEHPGGREDADPVGRREGRRRVGDLCGRIPQVTGEVRTEGEDRSHCPVPVTGLWDDFWDRRATTRTSVSPR